MGSLGPGFFLPADGFRLAESLFETRFAKLSKGIDARSGERVLVHSFHLIAFHSSALLDFAAAALSLYRAPDLPGLLPLVGLMSTAEIFSLVYRDPGVCVVDPRALATEARAALLRSVAQSLVALHAAGIAHHRVKPSSVFSDGSAFYLACLTPRSVVDLDSEDAELPLHGQEGSRFDAFLYGIFTFAVIEGVQQKDILNRLWKFEKLAVSDPLLDFAVKCLSFAPEERPSIEHFSAQFGVAPARLAKISADQLRGLLFHCDSPFCQILKAFILTEEKDFPAAIAVYDRFPESGIALNNKAKLLLALDQSPPTISQAIELFVKSALQNYSVGLLNAAQASVHFGGADGQSRYRVFLKLAADQGNLDAMALYGAEARSFDLTVSAHYLRAAARKGDPRAVHNYARTIGLGIAFKGDLVIDYLRFGAALGNPHCSSDLAIYVSDHADYANRLWRRGAEAGIGAAYDNLAISYCLGRGVERDDRKAATLMKRAADEQLPIAMFDYALMLRDGVGVERDPAAAAELCRCAGIKRADAIAAYGRRDRAIAALIATAPK
jgi:TPR repeat protein